MQHSTTYIVGFSIVVCVVCALFVASAEVSLRPLKELNARLDKQKNILSVAGLMQPGEDLDAEQIRVLFENSIQPRMIDLSTGEEDVSIDPTSFDQRAAARDPARSRRASSNPSKILRVPNQALIYEVIKNDEITSIIIPIEGYGLWSVLYGYLALAPDMRTILGITYYDQKETAGLGGEVENPNWKAKWVGRKAFDERGRVKIAVRKGPAGPPDKDPYGVDGLSGATITSRGVTNMLQFWLGGEGFGPYLSRLRDANAGA
ncbi:MAG: Na(+)-translocating NADH-quinone reductase subunit C [Myxococcota bacterium]|nr:Na(+)-translocating NADH-quinone reductase subunit C [Myxococcota bacterium]